jgi:putative nucleotidyltransferase with HDIG domain
MLCTMLELLSQRDHATARHSAAVAAYARDLCRAAGGSGREQQLAHDAGLLHDVGKAAFPDHILVGEQGLDADDWEVIRRHPEEGARRVRRVGLEELAEIIRSHHERIDGRGYPRGLCGEAIPWLARVVAVVDTYDVMTARDSYRPPVSPAAATAELRRVRGTQLDSRLVQTFIAMLSRPAAARREDPAPSDKLAAFERALLGTPAPRLRASRRWAPPTLAVAR